MLNHFEFKGSRKRKQKCSSSAEINAKEVLLPNYIYFVITKHAFQPIRTVHAKIAWEKRSLIRVYVLHSNDGFALFGYVLARLASVLVVLEYARMQDFSRHVHNTSQNIVHYYIICCQKSKLDISNRRYCKRSKIGILEITTSLSFYN